ncbi:MULTISPECIES: hypothetical protein [Lacticaseibacillus]|uniref:Uncharacterized protein n=1 Tax=Lacticaseibacillus hegangensis TaxID=2486010 RepID=A0ABW4CZQ0_9LACO|nr:MULTISPECIES: hypothetical protein [Lacticaseibacillus]
MAEANEQPMIDAATQMQLRDQTECERMIDGFLLQNLVTMTNQSYLA